MAAAKNPFRPTAGVSPPELDRPSGRAGSISLKPSTPASDIRRDWPWSLDSVASGRRCCSTRSSDLASQRGWHVVHADRFTGPPPAGRDRSRQVAPRRGRHPARAGSPASRSPGWVDWDTFERSGDQVDRCTRHPRPPSQIVSGTVVRGLMVTVDEVHAGPHGELRELAHLSAAPRARGPRVRPGHGGSAISCLRVAERRLPDLHPPSRSPRPRARVDDDRRRGSRSAPNGPRQREDHRGRTVPHHGTSVTRLSVPGPADRVTTVWKRALERADRRRGRSNAASTMRSERLRVLVHETGAEGLVAG